MLMQFSFNSMDSSNHSLPLYQTKMNSITAQYSMKSLRILYAKLCLIFKQKQTKSKTKLSLITHLHQIIQHILIMKQSDLDLTQFTNMAELKLVLSFLSQLSTIVRCKSADYQLFSVFGCKKLKLLKGESSKLSNSLLQIMRVIDNVPDNTDFRVIAMVQPLLKSWDVQISTIVPCRCREEVLAFLLVGERVIHVSELDRKFNSKVKFKGAYTVQCTPKQQINTHPQYAKYVAYHIASYMIYRKCVVYQLSREWIIHLIQDTLINGTQEPIYDQRFFDTFKNVYQFLIPSITDCQVQAAFLQMINQDEQMNVSFSLLDPISLKQIATPIRSVNCEHTTVFQYQPQNDTCPICGVQLVFGDLYEDLMLSSIIAQFGDQMIQQSVQIDFNKFSLSFKGTQELDSEDDWFKKVKARPRLLIKDVE